MTYKRVLLAVDESKYSNKAAQKGFGFARQLGASVAMVYIVSPVYAMGGIDSGIMPKEVEDTQVESGKKLLSDYVDKYSPKDYVDTFVRVETPARGILEIADEWKADLIVIGRHGLESFRHIVFGGVVDEVAKHTHIPVLLIPYSDD